MITTSDIFTNHFYEWEIWGRGVLAHSDPVALEPPFLPFDRSRLLGMDNQHLFDDGQFHTLSSWFRGLFKKEKPIPSYPEPESDEERPVKLDPFLLDNPDDEISELQVRLGNDKPFPKEAIVRLVTMLSNDNFPISFEIIGTEEEIITQFACRAKDVSFVEKQIKAFLPGIVVTYSKWFLIKQYFQTPKRTFACELCLQQEFMRPLASYSRLEPDPLTGLVGILEGLEEGQIGAVQILFHRTLSPWSSHMVQAVTDGQGKPFFEDDPEMVKLTKEKVSQPLLSCCIRTIGSDLYNLDQSRIISLLLAQALVTASERKGSNSLGLVSADWFDDPIQAAISARKSYRLGMLLNTEELVTLVHPFSPSVVSSKFAETKKTRPVPSEYIDLGYQLGLNIHQQTEAPVSLPLANRLRHTHIIGATGTGKSTLLTNLICQDIKQGVGCAVFDPHGDLIDDVLSYVDDAQRDRVVIIDPSHPEYSVGINILEAHSDAEKIMLASDLADVFKRQTTSWGDQMEVIMQNTIAAFLDSSKGGTMLDLRRFLIDGSFRKDFLKTVQDSIIWEYFQYDFPQKRNSSLQSLLSRLQMFFRPKPIRYMLMQQHGLKLGELMDEGAVILIKLSQGLIGESNSYLLGSLILTKFYQAALSRQRMGKEERRPFFIYLDEFQHFITPTLEGILTGARKYGLGLVLAHQSLDQLMKRDGLVGNAVLSNAGTRICFRTSEYDASQLAKGFSSFDSEDIQQLGIGEAIAKIGSSRHDFNLKTLLPPNLWEEEKRDNYLLTASFQAEKYGTPIKDLEEQLNTYHISRQHTKPQETKEYKAKDESSSPPPPSTPDQKEDLPSEQVVEPENILTDPPKLNDIQSAAEKFKQEAKKKEEVSEHRYLQNYVKQMAEARGYLSIIEAPTPDGKGRVDVLLSKGNTQLAVEIAVTTTNKHELGNITKCLKAGYSPIIILSQKPKRLQNIRSLAKEGLSEKDFQQLHFFNQNQFVSWLNEREAKQTSSEKTVKGYRVKVNYQSLSSKESSSKQQVISRVISRSIQEGGK